MPEEGAKRRQRRRGEGSVYQDKATGVWMASFSVGWKGGKRIRRKRVSRDGTKAGAERELAKLQRWYGSVGDVGTQTLGDYLDGWLEIVAVTAAPRTHKAYHTHVEQHITPLLGGIYVAALHQRDVRRLIRDRMEAGKSPQTVISIVSTLRTALGVAVKDGELPRNVAAGLDMPRVDRQPVEAMTPERATAILEAVKDDDLGSLFTVLLGTGLRLGEAIALDWGDVDLDAGRLTVRQGKTRSARRSVPLPRFVAVALREHRDKIRGPLAGTSGPADGTAGAVARHPTAIRRAVKPTDPVWVGARSGKRLERTTVYHAFVRLIEAAGLPKMTVHQLRHGTATLLLQRRVPMRDIADILGHSNPALTAQVYAHVSEGSKRRAMATLDEVAG